jgi:hypothetical protein
MEQELVAFVSAGDEVIPCVVSYDIVDFGLVHLVVFFLLLVFMLRTLAWVMVAVLQSETGRLFCSWSIS